MVNDLIPSFLTMQAQLKVYHWQTTNYAQHKALDFAYEELEDSIDSFIEIYQGKFATRLKADGGVFTLKIANYVSVEDTMKTLQTYSEYLINSVPKQIEKDDTGLLAIRDDMLKTFQQTMYLLSLS